MLDCHTHLLPGIDDGPVDLDRSLAALRGLVEQGVREVVVAPRWQFPGRPQDAMAVVGAYDQIQLAIEQKDLGLRVVLGALNHWSGLQPIDDFLDDCRPIGDWHLVLLDCGEALPDATWELAARFRGLGYVPILALAEQIADLGSRRNQDHLDAFCARGGLLQVGLPSLVAGGLFGSSRRARALLKTRSDNVIVASGAYGPGSEWGLVDSAIRPFVPRSLHGLQSWGPAKQILPPRGGAALPHWQTADSGQTHSSPHRRPTTARTRRRRRSVSGTTEAVERPEESDGHPALVPDDGLQAVEAPPPPPVERRASDTGDFPATDVALPVAPVASVAPAGDSPDLVDQAVSDLFSAFDADPVALKQQQNQDDSSRLWTSSESEWRLRGPSVAHLDAEHQQAVARAQASAAAAEEALEQGDRDTAERHIAAGLAAIGGDVPSGGLHSPTLARFLRLQGSLAQLRGESDTALGFFHRSRDLCRQAEDVQGLVRSHYEIAAVHARAGQDAEAQAQLAEALPMARMLDDRTILAHCLSLEGRVLRRLDQQTQALDIMREALVLAGDFEDRHEQQRLRDYMARMLISRGECDEAEAVLRENLRQTDRPEDMPAYLSACYHLGRMYGRQGERQMEAADFLLRAVEGFAMLREKDPQAPLPDSWARMHLLLAQLLLEGEAGESAQRHFRKALEAQEAEDATSERGRRYLLKIQVGLGNCAVMLHDLVGAQGHFIAARDLAQAIGDRATVRRIERFLGSSGSART